MFSLKEKQVRLITMALGAVTALLLGILGFRFLGEFLTSRASSVAPQNVNISGITQTSALVKWGTDQETQSVIEYGTTPTSLTFFAPEATRSKEHSVELNLLGKGTTYYFQVKTGDKVFDNGGVPWTFTTLSGDENADAERPATTPSPTAGATPEATVTAQPTTPVTKDTNCVLSEYKARFYTTDTKYDQDNNGVVNSRDWSYCQAKQGDLAPSSTPTPPGSLTPTTTLTPSPTP